MMWFLPAMLVFLRAWWGFTKSTGVLFQQAEFASRKPDIFTVSSWGIHKLWYMVFGSGEVQLRFLGLAIAVATSMVISKWLSRRFGLDRAFFVLMILLTPGMWSASFWYIPEIISLFFWGLWVNEESNSRLRGMWCILMATSSLSGLITAILISLNWIYKRESIGLIVGICISLLLVLGRHDLINTYKNSPLFQVNWSTAGQKINLDLQYISLGKKHMPISPVVQKLAYNKLVYIFDNVSNQIISVIDFTGWLSPQGAWQIVNLSGYPTKGVWPIFSYWELAIATVGVLIGITGTPWLIGLSSVIAASGFGGYEFGKYGIFLLPVFWFLVSGVIQKVTTKWGKKMVWLFVGLYLAGSINLWQDSFWKRENYLPARDYTFEQIYKLAVKAQDKNDGQIIISDRLGQTKTMIDFLAGKNVNTFKYAEITPTSLQAGYVYIGFDGEFKGPKKNFGEDEPIPGTVIDKIRLPNEPIYLYGNNLWLIKY